jgi:asparagine synthase (glutamine-hydrolysing)
MCGIVGVYDRSEGRPADRSDLRRARDLLRHRGPDQDGEYFDDDSGVALGVRRLAIVDLVTGDQPITNEDGTIVVVFNGEIYNHGELRRELEARGHRFVTRADTEAVVHAYEEWGLDCATRLNGIFAFAVWDTRARRMYLARDPYGVKPLYYAEQDGVLTFASELKGILAQPGITPEVDSEALHLCLTFRYVPSPWTLFRGIRKLAPGTYLCARPDGVEVASYVRAPEPALEDADPRELAEELRRRLRAAVRRQMMSDVPISVSLSGGVDSAAILSLVSDAADGPVQAFTIGFGENSEIPLAQEIAGRFGARLTTRVASPADYAEFLDRFVWHLEEPTSNESAPAYFFVAEMAHEHGIKVLLTGQGPDETFGGYTRYLGAAYQPMVSSLPPALMRGASTFGSVAARRSYNARRFTDMLAGGGEADRLLSAYTFIRPSLRDALLNQDVLMGVDHELPRAFVEQQLEEAPEGTLLERMLYVDARTSLADDLLLCEDKLSMAASVEARVPYLDLDYMAFAERVPGSLKIRLGRRKHLHREVVRDVIPRDVARRRKLGWGIPMRRWFRGELGHRLREAVNDRPSLTREYLDRGTVNRLLEEHAARRENHDGVLFLLLALESWFQSFIVQSEPAVRTDFSQSRSPV